MKLVEGTTTVQQVDRALSQLAEIGETHGTVVQAFDARYVVDRHHLTLATDLARRARERSVAIARDPAMEIMLYAAGRRQISRALEMGIAVGEQSVAVVVTGGDETGAAAAVGEWLSPADTVGAYDPERVCSFFDITETALAATTGGIAELVHERVALLVVNR
ncbi:MAG: hypothetical protein J07HX5_00453 [halophilic archaeon J07HX5]|jgi:Uncharacterized conserved protein|nr:MAG: hypothetical protein J07HX5_00453 [halophilic archaeon J07HX5]